MALRIKGLHKDFAERAGRARRLLANVRFELALLGLLLLTAAAVIWQDQILLRTTHFTPASTASNSHLVFSDADSGGKTVVRSTGPLAWDCDLRAGNPYPYCGYELFVDRNRGTHGLNLTHMRTLAITLMYEGQATSFRVHLKNFDPHYSRATDDDTPKYLRVEADTTPGKWQRTSFVPDDFGVADWWLRKYKLAPQYGRPQFDNITSIIIETGSEAPLGPHAFRIKDIEIRTAIMSDAQWYSLLLGLWILMIVAYLGYRLSNLRRALSERRTLEALALREAQEAARHDHLTKVLNRRGITERFEELRRARREAAMTVILIDIDHFKALNDSFGHDYGDQVLAQIAGVISRNVRGVDLVARWGGEEFVVVCAGIDRRGAQRVSEKIRECIESFDFGEGGRITASFGIHWSNAPETELSQMVALADIALYAAKAGGRNCVRLHRPTMKAA
ncbi:GGDEF domain-containing protein [Asticcacaulis taihuensis]|uniref:diguanylate cyclase n=1 Tax=Asticcacaulis taihuensis TaxID=260084 RepID=A0A1G4TVS4_9CAUL|nr:GGDEF domain-containing protein [Asticcacaulis taihuensis]SCW84669.1 diguanylate cyclase (GGDEF) domain-containing protein [Asticcacaulis taihuensis]